MIETLTTLILPAISYFFCLWATTLASWLVACAVVPRYCRCGLRLVMVLVGQIALTAATIQTLGLLGLLRSGYYLGICLAIAGVSLWGLQTYFPNRSLAELIRHQIRLWIHETPFGLGLLGFVWLGFATFRCNLVEGTDTLSIHAPLIVGWLQSETISLLWTFNYPICWELQFTANFLMMGTDILVVVPRLWIACTLLLLVKEVARQLKLSGGVGQLVAWICVSIPLVFAMRGDSTMKNDPAMATGLLLCLVALDRLWRNQSGGFWLLQLGTFLAMGTKSTGIVLAVGFMAVGLVIGAWQARHDLTPKRVVLVLVSIALMQATPIALPLNNFVVNGSPFFPIVVELGPLELPGEGSLEGTSILENRHAPRIWHKLFFGAGSKIGFEAAGIWLLFVIGAAWWAYRWLGFLLKRGWLAAIKNQSIFPALYYSAATVVLWGVFLATPWTAGMFPNTFGFVAGGASLRYALTQVFLTYLLAAVFVHRQLGMRRLTQLLGMGLPVMLYERWFPAVRHLSREAGKIDPNLVFLSLLAVVIVFWFFGKWIPSLDLKLRASSFGETAWPTLTLIALILALPVATELTNRLRDISWGEVTPSSQAFREVRDYVRDEMPDGSIIASNLEPIIFNFAYFFQGSKLENRFILVPDPVDEPELHVPADIKYFYLTYRSRQPARLQEGIRTLRQKGWQPLIKIDRSVGVLMQRTCPEDDDGKSCWIFGDDFESGDTTAWVSSPQPLPAGVE